MTLKILIVDDEPKVYQGLKRLLWTEKTEWDVHYASDGTQGLTHLMKSPVDVLISDYKMPLMDGSAFLSHVTENYPGVLRIVLSGECNREATYKLVTTAHLFLAKPTESKVLIDFIERSIRLKEILHNEKIMTIVNGLKRLPSLGGTYNRLSALLSDERTRIDQVITVISEDPSLIAKIMQIANSAFFNVNWRVTNLVQAINVIGYEVLKSLVMSHGLMQQFTIKQVGTLELSLLGQESVQLGFLARALSRSEKKDQQLNEDAFISGVLAKVGLIVTAQSLRPEMENAIMLCQKNNIPYHQAEREIYGCNHAEIGAYLLAIWGLPPSIIEAVGFHLKPSDCPEFQDISLLHYTHAAACMLGVSTQLKPSIYPEKDMGLFGSEAGNKRWEKLLACLTTFNEQDRAQA